MLRRLLAIAMLATLAACASEVEQCRIDATRGLREIDRQIDETQVNIARGYRVEYEASPFIFGTFACGRHFCGGADWDPVPRRIPINVPAERAKLNSLLEQRSALIARSRERLALCPQE